MNLPRRDREGASVPCVDKSETIHSCPVAQLTHVILSGAHHIAEAIQGACVTEACRKRTDRAAHENRRRAACGCPVPELTVRVGSPAIHVAARISRTRVIHPRRYVGHGKVRRHRYLNWRLGKTTNRDIGAQVAIPVVTPTPNRAVVLDGASETVAACNLGDVGD